MTVKATSRLCTGTSRPVPGQVPIGDRTDNRGHGRDEIRRIQTIEADRLRFPRAAQAIRITRRDRPIRANRWRTMDRDGAQATLFSAYLTSPVRFVLADAGFAGKLVDWAARLLATWLHIVQKPMGQRGFVLIPRRWPVERTFAWLTAHRRLARDYERHPAVSEAMIRWAAIGMMARRITRGHPAVRQQRWHWPDTLD